MPISYLCCWIIQEEESRDWSWGKCSCKESFRTGSYKNFSCPKSSAELRVRKGCPTNKKEIFFLSFLLNSFNKEQFKSSWRFPQKSNFPVCMRKGTHKSALDISGRIQPLFLLYCVLSINYFILIVSLYPNAVTFFFLHAFHQCENTAGNILLPLFRYSILFWKRYPSKDIFYGGIYQKTKSVELLAELFLCLSKMF